MGTRIAETPTTVTPRSIPTTGMRGGLGRTLLSAFLMITILPMGLIGWYAVRQNRLNLQREVEQKLQAVATLKAEELNRWVDDRRTLLLWSLPPESLAAESSRPPQWERLNQQVPDLQGVTLQASGQSLWSVGACEVISRTPMTLSFSSQDPWVALTVPRDNQLLVFCLKRGTMDQFLETEPIFGPTGRVYLIQNARFWPDGRAIGPAAAALQSTVAMYRNVDGVPVIGVYEPIAADSTMGILVEQEQREIQASDDRIAATFIAVILAAALATTLISAVVIRQITRPVIRLTESALEMADGNLAQHVTVTTRDEIGILTYVFNEMAAELKSLYDDLEAKVADRTKMLQLANYQIQRRALQLQASLEASQTITSIRDPAMLLARVVELIRERFAYASVALYLMEPGGGAVRLRAVSPARAIWPDRAHPGDGSVIDRAVRKGSPQVESEELAQDVEWYHRTLSRVVVPLRMEERVLGVLAVLSTEREGMQEDDLKVLEHLANQVAIALENARAYAREREASQRMEETEAFKSRFLANMSHELREPLNTVIGFSRLMLKDLDGPLNEMQRQDLQRIHDNSQRLLALINDMLDISQIQAGLLELRFAPVDPREIIDSVLPTASALVRGKDIVLSQELADSLPLVRADSNRIRQVLVRLLLNAAKFTQQGRITLRAWADMEQVYISVRDTGAGIPPEDRERIFIQFQKASNGGFADGAGLGLALSKEFVEMHGGQIWVESEVNKGSQFTFSLPLYHPDGLPPSASRPDSSERSTRPLRRGSMPEEPGSGRR